MKGLSISLRITRILLAMMPLMAGRMKASTSLPDLSKNLPWVLQVLIHTGLVRFVGLSEPLAGIGLYLTSRATYPAPAYTLGRSGQ